jgi:hypothetical protein
MSRRYYQNFVPQQTITGALSSGAGSVTVGSFTNWPTSFPFFAILDYGLASAEVVSVTNIIGNTATVVRGQGGSNAVSHLAGATFDFAFTAQDFDEANAHINSSSGVHNTSGAVVGTTDAQTLSNKTFTGTTTLAGVAASTLSVSGASTLAGATASGNITAASLTSTGTTTAATVSATTLNVSGNAGVTGAITAGSIASQLHGTSYANEAAADTAGVTVGGIVYLTAPTNNGAQAGLFAKLGTNNYAPFAGDTGWITPTLGASWVSFDGGAAFDIPQYKQKDGIVWVKGMAKSGTAGGVLFTLPAGFRAAKRRKFTCPAATGLAEINLNANGDVQHSAYYAGGTSGFISLEFSFPAEA